MGETYNPQTDVCEKCNKIFNEKWESKKTYEGIDQHHNPPEFLSEFLNDNWSGEFYNLCRKCHRKLHDEIIIILNKKANAIKFINSEYWILQKMNEKQIQEVKNEIYDFTKKWIKENDTKTTSKI